MKAVQQMSAAELVQLLETARDHVAVVDVRDYDKEGGILGAVLFPYDTYTPERMLQCAEHLRNMPQVVFHCTFSQVRGPKMALRFVKAFDELEGRCPAVFVLQGGWATFSNFYGSTHPHLFER